MPTITVPGFGPIDYSDSDPDRGGRAVVLVHGVLVDGTLWRDVVPRVVQHARCIVPTLPLGAHATPMEPGADLTPPGLARLIAGFLEALDLSDVVLVGNDTGGALCQLVVADHPERVGALVLTPCDAFENFLPKLFRPLQLAARSRLVTRLALRSLAFKPARRLPLTFGWLIKTRPLPHDLIDGWAPRSPAALEDGRRVLRGLQARYLFDAVDRMRRFERPVWLLWSRDDRVFTAAFGERLAAVFPNARVEWIDDSYAFAPVDQPGAVAQVILRALPASVAG